jgi:hypothetical protein
MPPALYPFAGRGRKDLVDDVARVSGRGRLEPNTIAERLAVRKMVKDVSDDYWPAA